MRAPRIASCSVHLSERRSDVRRSRKFLSDARERRPPSVSRGATRRITAHKNDATARGGTNDASNEGGSLSASFASRGIFFFVSRHPASSDAASSPVSVEKETSSPKSNASASSGSSSSSSSRVRSTVVTVVSRAVVSRAVSAPPRVSSRRLKKRSKASAGRAASRPPPSRRATPAGMGQCASSSAPYGHRRARCSMSCRSGSIDSRSRRGTRRASAGFFLARGTENPSGKTSVAAFDPFFFGADDREGVSGPAKTCAYRRRAARGPNPHTFKMCPRGRPGRRANEVLCANALASNETEPGFDSAAPPEASRRARFRRARFSSAARLAFSAARAHSDRSSEGSPTHSIGSSSAAAPSRSQPAPESASESAS